MICLLCSKMITKPIPNCYVSLGLKLLVKFQPRDTHILLVKLKSELTSSSPLLSDKIILRHSSSKSLISSNEEHKQDAISRKGGFAKAYDKFTTPETLPEQVEQSFPTLLKSSKFIDLGDAEGKIVTGTIIHVVENDLYVDFGWKFHCVVSRPLKNEHEYIRGAKVRLILKDLELSSRFLGSEKDLTLLEADATLIGLVSSPAKVGSM